MEMIAYFVLIILLPALVYTCKKSLDRCYTELKRQNHLLHSQTQTVSEINIWMQYFDEKIIKRENTSHQSNGEQRKVPSVETIKHAKAVSPEKHEPLPEVQDTASFQSPPVSIYKKTI